MSSGMLLNKDIDVAARSVSSSGSIIETFTLRRISISVRNTRLSASRETQAPVREIYFIRLEYVSVRPSVGRPVYPQITSEVVNKFEVTTAFRFWVLGQIDGRSSTLHLPDTSALWILIRSILT